MCKAKDFGATASGTRIPLGIFLAVIFATPALADPLPPDVEAMIREAAKSPADLKAVVKAAKATNPHSAAEIDALVAELQSEVDEAHKAKLASAGIFDNWSGSGQVGFNHTSGNTDDTNITAGLSLTKDGLHFRHKLNFSMDRESTSGVLTANRYLANYELDYKFNDRLYAYGLGGWDRDPFSGFSRRFSESGGVGYSLLTGPAMTLDLTGGPAFRQTTFVDGTHLYETTARAALEFAWKIRDSLTLSENASVYVNSQETSTTALTEALTSALSARVSFDVIHEEKPLAGRKSTDTATKVSLVYGF